MQLLREHVERYWTGPDGQLFTSRGGTYQPSTLWQVLQKARVVAFTPSQVASPLARKPYDFRHAGVSWGSTRALLARRWLSGAAVKGYLDELTDRAAAPVIAKYIGVLAAADVEAFTRTTTFTILQSMRLDLGPSSPLHA